MPDDDCWTLNSEIIKDLNNGEILIQTEYLSIDPYMRGKMNDTLSYTPPLKIGEVMVGESVGRVIESKSKKYEIGDLVTSSSRMANFHSHQRLRPIVAKSAEEQSCKAVFFLVP